MRKVILSLISLIPTLLFAQASHVFVDGFTNDWSTCTNKYNDEAGDGNSIDILQLRAMNDENYLYLTIKTYEEFQLSDDNTLSLLIDADGNASTGFKYNGIGAEIKWDFGRRRGAFYYNGGSFNIDHDNIGLLALPTTTSREFEIAISLTEQPELFTCDSIRMVLYDSETNGDILPESGKFITYYFDKTELPGIETIYASRNDAGHLRLMTWNMLSDGIADVNRSESFERILSAVSPDIITFNEAWNTEATTVKTILNRILPLTDGASWQVHKIVDGNITASRYPIKKSFDVVSGHRISAHLIDLPDEKFNKDIVVFNCHFKCCSGESADETRQYEVDGLMSFVNKMKEGYSSFQVEANTPFVFMGDFNLVGASKNLSTLLSGVDGLKPDWDNNNMTDNVARNANKNTAYTFIEEGTSYWPGRLDYILYTASQMKLQKSFIFESTLLPADYLEQIGVEAGDNLTASDHLPHIADFTLEASSAIPQSMVGNNIQVFPNPANDKVSILGLDKTTFNKYQLVDMLGKTRKTGLIIPNNGLFELNVSNLQDGIYFIMFKGEESQNDQTLRIIIRH
jgi:hypothetical protein